MLQYVGLAGIVLRHPSSPYLLKIKHVIPLLVPINIHQFERAQPYLLYIYILTFDINYDALADGRWYTIGCYTKISAHFRPTDASQIKLLALVHGHCKIRKAVLLNNSRTKRGTLRSFKGEIADCWKVGVTSMSGTMKGLSLCIVLIPMKNSCS